MTVSIRSMRYFVTALAHGNISQAAAELNIAASAVGTAIDQIEAQLQLKLVNRHRSRGIAATASGRVMERKFRHLLEEYEEVMAEGAELKQSLKGDLRIGYYAPVAPAFMPTLLFRLAGPDGQTTFHLEECDNDRAQSGLLSGDFDAILFVSDAALPQIEFDVLTAAPAYCLVSAEHPFAQQRSVDLKDLVREPIIVLNRPAVSDYYRRLFEETGQSPATLAYANSTEMVRSLVGAGLGCAVLNMLPIADVSYAGDRLSAVPIRNDLQPLSLSIGYDKTSPRRIVNHFADACRSYFRDGPGSRHVIAA
ncbi:LysR family transcriptional regulator [Hoeflea poritis]|uniref:LysR family transcriptional regulator n=1 Tax=Hoeflea poritis TaxID=2993659 RepID=A0ABT4VSW3_9HYPH|nr:LysR family transcriptional regulator [Hoeflea poritis]MDA4847162.1 LysR family transcriptional regulator [Hoeflea poritis]